MFLQASISEEQDDFQQLILGVLQKEFIPESKVLHNIDKAAGTNFQVVLQGAVNTLCKDLTWTRSLTMKQKFCWGLVAACCSKIKISREDLDWVHSYGKLLQLVGYVFNVYCSGRKLMGIIIEQLPQEIETSLSEDIQWYIICTYMCAHKDNSSIEHQQWHFLLCLEILYNPLPN